MACVGLRSSPLAALSDNACVGIRSPSPLRSAPPDNDEPPFGGSNLTAAVIQKPSDGVSIASSARHVNIAQRAAACCHFAAVCLSLGLGRRRQNDCRWPDDGQRIAPSIDEGPMIEQAVRQVAKGRGGVDVDQVRQGRHLLFHLLFRGRGVGQVLEGPFRRPPRCQGREGVVGRRREKKASSNGGSGKASKLGKGGEMSMASSSAKSEKAEGAEGGGGERRAAHHGEVLEVSQHARGQERRQLELEAGRVR